MARVPDSVVYDADCKAIYTVAGISGSEEAVMAYLLAHYGMSFDSASELLGNIRIQSARSKRKPFNIIG